MTESDFQKIIIPCLKEFTFVPSPDELDLCGHPLADAYWMASNKEYRIYREGQERLLPVCDAAAVGGVLRNLRLTYETAVAAHERNVAKLKLITSRHHCEVCRARDNEIVSTDSILQSYFSAHPLFPHEIDLDSECATWCEAPWLLPLEDIPPGPDSEFTEMLRILLRK
ncbi:hypothetical protein ACO0LD_05335 [Undibacterium sp. Ji83W]|uniref:hypothetical protein n=1 Tax=Undibacterium sp. Ji83W TaxID=3413043 RepID=UPI003BF1E993